MITNTRVSLTIVGAVASALWAGAASPLIAIESKSLRDLVRPFPSKALAVEPVKAAASPLLGDYYDSVAEWSAIVSEHVRPTPGNADYLYLGLPGNVENDVRPTAYAAMVLSFMAEFKLPDADIGVARRDRHRREAIGLLRYLTSSHVTGDGACVNGKQWGNAWQSAMWARVVGMAAWQMWDHLDADLQEATARLVVFEADRFLTQPPKSSKRNDTGAEENAWNAAILSLACNMLPQHPRSTDWEHAAKRYMYNSFSVAADADDTSPGDDDKPIRDWVTTINAHDDFTVENHGLVHVGYLKPTATELQENALHWLIVDKAPPQACQHHVPEVFQVLLNCMDWQGSPIYFAGNDWKIYQSQASDVLLYCGLNLLANDSRAAYLEQAALDRLRAQQHAEGGYYNVRRDLEYSGFCASRIIMACFAHAVADSNADSIDASRFDREASGVRLLRPAKTVVHRTPNKFASFSWAQKRVALTLSRDGCSVVWPHFSSYLGYVNGEESSSKHAKLAAPDVEIEADAFRVTGTLVRCRGKLLQDFFFCSPADDLTVYIERMRPDVSLAWKSRETGVVGLDYSIGHNTRKLYGEFGQIEATGTGNTAAVVELSTNWLNIDNKIGYVVCREPAAGNLMRFHDRAAGEGRVPHLQEWISLVGDATPPAGACNWACIVTFPNQTAEQTRKMAGEVKLSIAGDKASCSIGDRSFSVQFGPANEANAGATQ